MPSEVGVRADHGPPSQATSCAAVLLIEIDSIPLIGPTPDARPLQHHPDGCFRHVQDLANCDVGVPLGQSGQHLRCGSERLVIIERQPSTDLALGCFRWSLGDHRPRPRAVKQPPCPRPVVSQWSKYRSVIFDVT